MDSLVQVEYSGKKGTLEWVLLLKNLYFFPASIFNYLNVFLLTMTIMTNTYYLCPFFHSL